MFPNIFASLVPYKMLSPSLKVIHQLYIILVQNIFFVCIYNQCNATNLVVLH